VIEATFYLKLQSIFKVANDLRGVFLKFFVKKGGLCHAAHIFGFSARAKRVGTE